MRHEFGQVLYMYNVVCFMILRAYCAYVVWCCALLINVWMFLTCLSILVLKLRTVVQLLKMIMESFPSTLYYFLPLTPPPPPPPPPTIINWSIFTGTHRLVKCVWFLLLFFCLLLLLLLLALFCCVCVCFVYPYKRIFALNNAQIF